VSQFLFKFVHLETEKNRKNLDCHLNISYGSTQRQKLDIYGDDLPSSAPLFVFVHGGYWQMLDKNESAVPVAVRLVIFRILISEKYDFCYIYSNLLNVEFV
jgi:acetyl esterase/lipase